jgi:hypothetical protein
VAATTRRLGSVLGAAALVAGIAGAAAPRPAGAAPVEAGIEAA